MELQKTAIAEKIKRLNTLLSLIEKENEATVSQLNIDSMLATVRELYLDVLDLHNQNLTQTEAMPAAKNEADDTASASSIISSDLHGGEEDTPQQEKVREEQISIFEEDLEEEKNEEEKHFEKELPVNADEDSTDFESIEQVERAIAEEEKYSEVEPTASAEASADFEVADGQTEQTLMEEEEQVEVADEKEREEEQQRTTPFQTEIDGFRHLEQEEVEEPVLHQNSIPKEEVSVLDYFKSSNVANAAQNITNRFESHLQNTPKVQTIADKFSQDKSSIFDKMASQNDDHSISSKLQRQGVNDLRDIIGLNEKFSFINELFSGNASDYTNFILLLNESKTIEEAETHLHRENNARNWEHATTAAYTNLLKLVERKFA